MGSEMCIRDRSGSGLRPLPDDIDPGRGSEVEVGVHGERGRLVPLDPDVANEGAVS